MRDGKGGNGEVPRSKREESPSQWFSGVEKKDKQQTEDYGKDSLRKNSERTGYLDRRGKTMPVGPKWASSMDGKGRGGVKNIREMEGWAVLSGRCESARI